MTDHEVMQMALDALLTWKTMHPHTVANAVRTPAIEALRARLAEKEQEPVAWYLPSDEGFDSLFRDHRTVVACTGNKWEGWQPLYAAPPQREWQGLTDEEIEKLFVWQDWSEYFVEYEPVARAIEAKLKEKNT